MLRYGLILCLALPGAASAQAWQGLNDNGRCVENCSRYGGRPCQPCMPRIGPGADGWPEAVARTEADNQRFKVMIDQRAATDDAYRRSDLFKQDMKAFRVTRKAVGAMENLTKFSRE